MRVIEILFGTDKKVKLIVEMPNPEQYSTDEAPHIPNLLFKLFPHLSRHKCDNEKGLSFKKECQHTEIPHLFEHLIIEIQGQVLKTGVLRGETEWDWRVDPKGRFHVTVEYENELLVMGSIRVAERIINALDNREIEIVDVKSEVKNLSKLAELEKYVKSGDKISSSI